MKNNKTMTILMPLLFAGLVVLFSASYTLAAKQPVLTKKPVVVVEKFDFPDFFAFPCEQGFDTVFDNVAKVTLIQWFDEEGNLIRYQANSNILGTVSRSSDGKGVRDKAVVNFSGDSVPPDATSEIHRGLFLNLKFPNGANKVLEVGRIVFNTSGDVTFVSGQTLGLAQEEVVAQICAGLASL